MFYGLAKYLSITLSLICFVSLARANIIGNPVQNFNPNYSKQDFITVHSSNTISKNKFNLTYFVDYGQNTLFSIIESDSPDDSMLFSTFAFGYGISENWDVGFTMPYIFYQNVEDPDTAGKFDKEGLLEFRISSKYRFKKFNNGGISLVANFGLNRTEGLPYFGDILGNSLSLELVTDYSWNKWLWGLNLGYRHFNSGEANSGFTAFGPFSSALMASASGRYQINSHWFAVCEAWGTVPETDFNKNGINRSKNSFEFLMSGLYKKILSNNNLLNLSFGLTTQLGNGLSTPDWRFFVGSSYTFGFNQSAQTSKAIIEKKSSNEEIKTQPFVVETKVEEKTELTKNTNEISQIYLKDDQSSIENTHSQASEEKSLYHKNREIQSVDFPQSISNNDDRYLKSIEEQEALTKRQGGDESQAIQSLEPAIDENTESFSMNTIHFAFDSANLKPSSYVHLNKLAEYLKNEKYQKLIISGHTDSIGSLKYNEGLSLRRANAVLAYLRLRGVKTHKIIAEGYGESKPLEENKTAKGRAKNRRVEFRIQR